MSWIDLIPQKEESIQALREMELDWQQLQPRTISLGIQTQSKSFGFLLINQQLVIASYRKPRGG